MMEYDVFRDIVAGRIKEFLPPLYRPFDIRLVNVPKINGMRDALILSLDSDNCRMVAPNIYLDDLYEQFCSSNDLDDVMEEAAMIIVEFTGAQRLDHGEGAELEKYRNNIVKMLINTEMNKQLLQLVPHKEFLDLSIIYRIIVDDMNESGYGTALITNDLMEELAMTPDELEMLAEKNSSKLLKTKVAQMGPIFKIMLTEAMIYGGINMTRLDELKKIADEFDSNLYIIPSSIHDIIAVKECNEVNEKALALMIKEANDKCNSQDDNLSYNLYYYDRQKNSVELRILADKNKRNG